MASTSPSPSEPRRSPTSPSRRPSRTSTHGSGPGPTRWSGWAWTSRRRARSSPAPARCRGMAGRLRAGPARPPGRDQRERRRRSRSPTGSCALTSTPRPAPSRWTAFPATAGWWTAATSATPTTTPRPGRTRSSTRPLGVTVRVDERGPVRARVRITSTYDWPDHVDGSSQARVGGHQVDVAHRRGGAGGRRHGAGGDHLRQPERRPSPTRPPARSPNRRDHSEAESAFTVVTRGLTAEGRPDEFGLPTAPANRFVSAGRLTVVHEGVCEYELIDIEEATWRTPWR